MINVKRFTIDSSKAYAIALKSYHPFGKYGLSAFASTLSDS